VTRDRRNVPPDERLALAFSQHVVRLQGTLAQAIAPALSAHDLTPAELDVVATLLTTGEPYRQKPKELTAHLLLTTGGLSNVLRRLENRGLVSRVPDPADRRSNDVRLTPDGVAVARAATGAANAALRRLLAEVPAATLETALHQLGSVLDAVGDTRAG